ncbi:hypothetical protein J6590_088966 [Homalodisca vitripennis]|nr:hypothetical protein J6590_088966 [Homalodisca vitripennis]
MLILPLSKEANHLLAIFYLYPRVTGLCEDVIKQNYGEIITRLADLKKCYDHRQRPKIDRRSRKRAPPKLGAKQKKKQSHATSGKRQKARQDFEYWPSSRSNIWQRSLHPSPRKFSIRSKKTFLIQPCSRRNEWEHYTPVGCRSNSAGRARAFSWLQCCGQTRRISPADGTHGDPIKSQHNQ